MQTWGEELRQVQSSMLSPNLKHLGPGPHLQTCPVQCMGVSCGTALRSASQEEFPKAHLGVKPVQNRGALLETSSPTVGH